MKWPLVTLRIALEDDVVTARQRARSFAKHAGFGVQDQSRIATAVSEIARNAYGYAGGGKVEYGIDETANGQDLVIRVSDRGPGIADLSMILEGRHRSTTGLGLGIVGARRLMDRFDAASAPGQGTVVTLGKRLPASGKLNASQVRAIGEALAKDPSGGPGAALREQNRELIRSLSDLSEREDEAQRLVRELADTNRGVVALHAELESQAAELREAGTTLENQVAARTAELADANLRLRAEAMERERMEADLRQSQKMEAVGQLTGGIAHDFNNLLTGIVGALELIQKRLAKGQTGDVQKYIEAATSSANRAAALTHRLLAFARRQPLDPKIVDVNALVVGMTELLRRTISEAIDLRIVTAQNLWMTRCDPHQLENAILNLAINARDAMPSGGMLTIEARNGSLPEGAASAIGQSRADCVCLAVTDTGAGMSPDVVARAFDPFFTTKPLGQGTGLGLSMIYGFVRQSEGYARIESEVGKGASVTIYLPRHEGSPENSIAEAMPPRGGSGLGKTVLVVEDEKVVRDLVVEALQDQGYHALEASDGPSGLALLLSNQPIDLLLTDVGLPGMNGRQLADQARIARPRLKILFMTGYAESVSSPTGFLDAGMSMITKPFTTDAIVHRIRHAIDSIVVAQ